MPVPVPASSPSAPGSRGAAARPNLPASHWPRPELASYLTSELIFPCQVPYKDFLSFSVWVWLLFGFGFAWGGFFLLCGCCSFLVFWEGRSEDEVQLFDDKLLFCVSVVCSPVILPVCISGLGCNHSVTDCLSQGKVWANSAFQSCASLDENDGNNFPLDEKVLNLFGNSLWRTTLPLAEAAVATRAAWFSVPCGRAAPPAPSGVCRLLKNPSDSFLLLERVTFSLKH